MNSSAIARPSPRERGAEDVLAGLNKKGWTQWSLAPLKLSAWIELG